MAAVRSAQEYVRVLNFERDPAGARGRATPCLSRHLHSQALPVSAKPGCDAKPVVANAQTS